MSKVIEHIAVDSEKIPELTLVQAEQVTELLSQLIDLRAGTNKRRPERWAALVELSREIRKSLPTILAPTAVRAKTKVKS